MKAVLECVAWNIKSTLQRRAISTFEFDPLFLAPRSSSAAISRERIKPLSPFERRSLATFHPLQSSLFSVTNRSTALHPHFQKRALSLQQTGLKQTFSSDPRDRWDLKIFPLLVFSALLSGSTSVLASEHNPELNEDELREIAEQLRIEQVDDPKALQQECFTQLMSLCLRGKLDLLKRLDARKIVKLKDLGGNTLLIASIREGADSAIVQYLMEAELASKVRGCDAEGNSPLHIAAEEGRDELIEALWPYLDRKNNKGETPLHLAIQYDREECVRRLQNNLRDSLRCGELELSPIALAVKAGAMRALRVLSPEGKGLDQPILGCGNILHLAILFGQKRMVESLFHEPYFEEVHRLLIKEDPQGRIPFALACAKGDCEMASFLYDKGKTLFNSKDLLNHRSSFQGWTPTHWAAQQGQYPIIHLLGSWGAKLGRLDNQGRRPEKVAEESLSGLDRETTLTALRIAQKGKDYSGFQNRSPQNIVFQGGGPKGIVYVGALRALREKRSDLELDRAAGTSAGAISACLYALGYSPEEMEVELSNKNFLQLLDPKNETCNTILQAMQAQKNTESYAQLIKALLSKGAAHILGSPRQAYRELSGIDGLCKGEDARNWIEGLIHSQVKKITEKEIPFLTFGELRALKGQGFPFKHIRIFVTPLSGEKPRCFSSENKEDDHFIISDVVRASMSIPGVFEPHVLHYKDPKTGRRKADPDGGWYVDGGLLRNFPVKIYDEPDGRINRRTLGLSLKKEKSETEATPPKNPIELAQAIARIYYEAETLLQNEENNNRVIEIPTLGVSTLDFDLSQEQIQELIRSGYDAVMKSNLFAPLSSQTPNSSRLRIVCAPLSNFTGRSSEAKKLIACLKNRALPLNKRPIVLLISGLPGVGKTELARKAVDQALDPLDHSTCAFELDYRDLDSGYREIAARLEILFDDKSSPETIRRKVFRALERLDTPWFLILNNVEGDQKVNKDLVPSFGGYLLITAHSNEAWSDPDEHVQLDALDPEDGAQLIAQITEEKMSDEIRDLAKGLSYYPLALDQVARFIRGSHSSGQPNDYTVKEYLTLHGTKFSSMSPNMQGYQKTLEEAWTISLDHFKTKYPKAWEWLSLSAWFNSDEIPATWLESWLRESSSQGSETLEAKNIIKLLRNYGFVREANFSKSGQLLSMHGLLQEFIRKSKDPDIFKESVKLILKRSEHNRKIYETRALVASHLNCIVTHAINLKVEKDPLFVEILLYRGRIRMHMGEYKGAIEDFEEVVKLQTQSDCPSLETANALSNLGNAYYEWGEPIRGVDYHQQALAIFRQIYGEKLDYNIPKSLNNLGRVYQATKKPEQALGCYQEALSILKQLGDDERIRRGIANNLNRQGRAYQALGRIAEAIESYEKALEIRQQVFGDQPRRATSSSLTSLGNAYAALGDTTRAIEFYQQALKMRLQLYGDQAHRDLINSYNCLTNSYATLGEMAQAIEFYEKASKMRKQLFGDRPDRDTAINLEKLGLGYLDLGHRLKAVEYLQSSYEMFTKTAGQEDPDTKRVKGRLNQVIASQKPKFCQIL